jgi:hypothetical protein
MIPHHDPAGCLSSKYDYNSQMVLRYRRTAWRPLFTGLFSQVSGSGEGSSCPSRFGPHWQAGPGLTFSLSPPVFPVALGFGRSPSIAAVAAHDAVFPLRRPRRSGVPIGHLGQANAYRLTHKFLRSPPAWYFTRGFRLPHCNSRDLVGVPRTASSFRHYAQGAGKHDELFLMRIPILVPDRVGKPEPVPNEAHSDEPGLWNWNKMEQVLDFGWP